MEAKEYILDKAEILTFPTSLEKSNLALVFGAVEEFSEDMHEPFANYINSENIVYCSTSGHFVDQSIEE